MDKKLDRDYLIKIIDEKQRKLKETADYLKSYFVGLDSIIDKIISNIEAWYILPEFLTRPVIINLWGMTGVGKTDLVRQLVKSLGFSDRFCEIELTTKGASTHSWDNSIADILEDSSLDSNKPGILLLDEIQKFRTIDSAGLEIHDYKFQDIWSLLSDGKLVNKPNIDFILSFVYENSVKKRKIKKNIKQPNEDNTEVEKEDDSISYYRLKYIKRALKLSNSVEEIASWDTHKIIDIMQEKMANKSLYEHNDFSKLLIFISGNIDEAFKFSGEISESDIDADIFYKQSLRINILDIKNALRKRFRPEQIARFGNIHVVYPSLSRDSYAKIIDKKLKCIKNNIYEKCGIYVNIDKSIHNLIYENGVFPVQGARPVFSTIGEIVESNLSTFIFKAFLNDVNSIDIFYKNKNICSKIDKNIYKIPYLGSLDKLKNSNKHVDKVSVVSVHESGHALLYGLLYKKSPLHLTSLTKSNYIGGFCAEHTKFFNKQFKKMDIVCALGGKAAEEIVFSNNFSTCGSSEDLNIATSMAAMMIRQEGLDDNGKLSYTVPITDQSARIYNTDMEATNDIIENILKEAYKEASQLLNNHMELFKSIIVELSKNYIIEPKKMQKIFEKHGIDIEVSDGDKIMYPNFNYMLKKFLGE